MEVIAAPTPTFGERFTWRYRWIALAAGVIAFGILLAFVWFLRHHHDPAAVATFISWLALGITVCMGLLNVYVAMIIEFDRVRNRRGDRLWREVGDLVDAQTRVEVVTELALQMLNILEITSTDATRESWQPRLQAGADALMQAAIHGRVPDEALSLVIESATLAAGIAAGDLGQVHGLTDCLRRLGESTRESRLRVDQDIARTVEHLRAWDSQLTPPEQRGALAQEPPAATNDPAVSSPAPSADA